MRLKALAAAAALLWTGSAFGQAAPTMNQEKHHERLTYIRHMRVFELNLPAGAATPDIMQDYDMVTIPLTGAMTGTAQIAEYTGKPATRRVENAAAAPMRAMVVENLRDRGWTMPPALAAPGTTLQRESRSFAIYDMRLNLATPKTNHVHQNPTFIFLVSGEVQVNGGGGESEFRLEAPGRWFPSSGPEQPHALTLVGTADAHVICVEAR
jgi:hypothetical protein